MSIIFNTNFLVSLTLCSMVLFLTRNPFTWVFCLLLLFFIFSISIFFLSEFIGLLILLIYTGGISILFVFTCIPLNVYSFYYTPVALDIPILLLIILKLLLYKNLLTIKPVYFIANSFAIPTYDMTVYTLAENLYLKYPILLCVVSFFLLLCMVGSLSILRATL